MTDVHHPAVPIPCKESFNPFKLAFYSALGVLAADCVLYPIDTIATRLKANKREYQTFRRELKQILRWESPRSLLRGFSTTFAMFVPNLTYFWIYESMNKKGKSALTFSKENSRLNKLRYMFPILSALVAESVGLLLFVPFDLIRTRMQANTLEYNYRNIFDGINKILKSEGIIRLYKASPIYLINSLSFNAFQMFFYESSRSYLLLNTVNPYRKSTNQLSLSESIISSFLVTMTATLVVNPLDVLLTRIQLIDGKKETPSIRMVVNEIFKNEGWSAFYKGLTPRLINSVVYGLLWLPIYEICKAKYGISMHEEDEDEESFRI